jgi:hypothetical protein
LAEEQLPADRRGGDMAIDLVLARPIGLLSIIGGSVLFVVSLPFTIPSGSMDAAAVELVKKPIDYTFKRPLCQIGQESIPAADAQPPRPDPGKLSAGGRSGPCWRLNGGRAFAALQPGCNESLFSVASVPSPASPAGILLRAQ